MSSQKRHLEEMVCRITRLNREAKDSDAVAVGQLLFCYRFSFPKNSFARDSAGFARLDRSEPRSGASLASDPFATRRLPRQKRRHLEGTVSLVTFAHPVKNFLSEGRCFSPKREAFVSESGSELLVASLRLVYLNFRDSKD